MSSPREPSTEVPELSVVVPAYKEADTIHEALTRLTAALDEVGRSYEVIVVSDGNDDGTEQRAEQFGHDRVTVLHYTPNRGKGFALKHGAGLARGEIVVFIDADLDIHPDGIEPLVSLLLDTPADAVVASKVHPGSNVSYPAFRRMQSSVLRLLIRMLFDLSVTDTQTGLKVFRAPVLRTCLPHVASEGFAFDLELLVLANDHHFKVVEGPLELDFRFSSTTGARAVVDVLKDLVKLHRRRAAGLRDGSWLA
jgi:glycosyltransferase involved in cell wall biosynthesis